MYISLNPCSALQSPVLQCSAVQFSAVQCSAVQCKLAVVFLSAA